MKASVPLLISIKIFLLWILLLPFTASSQNIEYAKTYFNVTKGTTGGTVEPGDVIEVRATFVVKGGAVADSCGFFDVVPIGTTYIAGSLKVLTNEAKVYKTFTDLPGDDCGYIVGTSIRINLGFANVNPTGNKATAFRRGTVRATDRPSLYTSSCIMIASYRISIASPYGSVINLGGGSATYRIGAAALQTITFNPNRITIFQNSAICSNSVGGNTLGAEFNGTFGSGKPRNRGASASVPTGHIYQLFTTGTPVDYNYGIANNTSTLTNYTTSNTWAKPDNSSPTHRVFSYWDIIGDHTGAVNPFLGNPAADTVANPNAGYMLVINASYKTDSAFQHTITNLCPNTYYEISAWFRNICSKCGCDSTGKGANAAGYIPTAPGDSSGVYPSLTFDVDGTDYYSTGLIKYTGQWIKKGFTYLTGPSQTSFKLTVKNNAPGGGGNDWAIDDIAVATCTPNLDMKPSPTVNVCYGSSVNMSCDVRCFFSNYIYWLWERSNNNGLTWTNTGITGIGTPVMVAGQWQYTANYPTFPADSAAANAMYRIKVGSTLANLNNTNCSFTASSTIRVYVNNCMQLLNSKLISFNGKRENDVAKLNWVSANETSGIRYDIERSSDGLHFTNVSSLPGIAGYGNGSSYDFTDEKQVEDILYYRIKLVDGETYKYSRVIVMTSGNMEFQFKSWNSPFESNLNFEVQSPTEQKLTLRILDMYGRPVRQTYRLVTKGINKININDLGNLSAGAYILSVEASGKVVNQRVIKSVK